MKAIIKGIFIMLGYVTIAMISLVLCLFVGSCMWDIVVRPSGDAPGNGIGFLVFLGYSSPIWVIAVIASPFIAHGFFPLPVAVIQRIITSLLLPVIVAIGSSILILQVLSF